MDHTGKSYEEPPLIENHEEIPKGQDPPEVASCNDNFSMSFRGKLLSVVGLGVGKDGDTHSFSMLWTSPELIIEVVSEIGGNALMRSHFLRTRQTLFPNVMLLMVSEILWKLLKWLTRIRNTSLILKVSILTYVLNFCFSLVFLFVNFTIIFFSTLKDTLRVLPADELSKISTVLGLKVVVAGRLMTEKIQEKYQCAADFNHEVKNLRQDLDKAQSSNQELEAQVAQLKEALKISKGENKLIDVVHVGLKKEYHKLSQARSDDEKVIENLWNLVDEGTSSLNDLRGRNAELLTQNVDLVKALVLREKRILGLKQALNERVQIMSEGAAGIKKSFELLFEKYDEALG